MVYLGTLALLPINFLLLGLELDFHQLAINHTGRTIENLDYSMLHQG